jgi:hypothetical protein
VVSVVRAVRGRSFGAFVGRARAAAFVVAGAFGTSSVVGSRAVGGVSTSVGGSVGVCH